MRPLTTIPSVLVVTEGSTEKTYLDHLRRRDMGWSLIVKKASSPDPVSVVRSCVSLMSDKGIDTGAGDMAFAAFDWDRNSDDVLRKAFSLAEEHDVGVLFSKPCFEIVFLAHFTDDVSRPKDQKDTLSMLEKYIGGYSKTTDYWNTLSDKQERARRVLEGFSSSKCPDCSSLPNGSNVFDLFDVVRSFRRLPEVP